MSDENYRILEQNIIDIKKHFWENQKVILHSRDIRKCDKEFSVLLDQTLKHDFYTQINQVISSVEYTIIASAINKDKYIKRYGLLASDVYQIALSFIIERSVFYLDGLKDDNKLLSIIIEKRGKNEDNMLQNHFQRLCVRGTAYVTPDRIHTYCKSIEFKSKNDDITGIQIADLIAYPIARYILDPKRANPSFDIFKQKFYSKRGKSYGLKVFP